MMDTAIMYGFMMSMFVDINLYKLVSLPLDVAEIQAQEHGKMRIDDSSRRFKLEEIITGKKKEKKKIIKYQIVIYVVNSKVIKERNTSN